MPTDSTQDITLKVSSTKRSDEPLSPAGVITIDGQQKIHVVSAEPAFAAMLDLAAENLNGSDVFMIRVVPPDAEPFSLHKDEIPRDSPGARDAVLQLLEKDYRFTLEPAS